MARRLPPSCGLDLDKPLLQNPYQQQFLEARRLRYCTACKTVSSMGTNGGFTCLQCAKAHVSNLTAPHVFNRLMLRAGRRSGKSLVGAHAAREEMLVPNTIGWVCGPTFKILHDATMPTLLRLIPPDWVANWNQDNLELRLVNGSMVQFRSLDDPERGRGQGVHWAWFDEAAFMVERAWDVFSPSLAENAGIAFLTTSPGGFDWTYRRFMRPALISHEPGFWAARYTTLDNPLFKINPVLEAEVDRARREMPPEVFAAEYMGEDVNFTGAIYGQTIEPQILVDNEAIKALIPEWPAVDPSRQILIGLDSGADHPFGAVVIAVTEKGLVVIGEYLERQQAMVTHLTNIQTKFGTQYLPNLRWAANKNEAQLRLEFGLRGVGVIQAENKHKVGIQRVQSWLQTKQLFFSYTCPKTIEQMKTYRYADNYTVDGQKRDQEQVFKLNDELPDACRYALMSYPQLPATAAVPMTDTEQARWNALSENSRLDIERIRDYNKRDTKTELEPMDESYPIGDFYGHGGEMGGW